VTATRRAFRRSQCPPVHVWYALTEQLAESAIAEARDLLSPAERARCDRFLFERDRRDFATAHALLRRALTVYGTLPPAQWVFDEGAHGKPFLAPGQSALEFNLAHTHGLVACVLTNAGPVGVDVESLDRAVNTDAIAERYFSPAEIRALRATAGVERQARFIELWTLKEAYLKAIGAGLSNPLNDFGFDLNGTSALRFNAPPESASAGWQFALFAPSARHRMAVAVRSERQVEFQVNAWPPGTMPPAAMVRTSAAS
jgi:4'-phosphopantetheinyl transferase